MKFDMVRVNVCFEGEKIFESFYNSIASTNRRNRMYYNLKLNIKYFISREAIICDYDLYASLKKHLLRW